MQFQFVFLAHFHVLKKILVFSPIQNGTNGARAPRAGLPLPSVAGQRLHGSPYNAHCFVTTSELNYLVH